MVERKKVKGEKIGMGVQLFEHWSEVWTTLETIPFWIHGVKHFTLQGHTVNIFENVFWEKFDFMTRFWVTFRLWRVCFKQPGNESLSQYKVPSKQTYFMYFILFFGWVCCMVHAWNRKLLELSGRDLAGDSPTSKWQQTTTHQHTFIGSFLHGAP